MKVGVQLRYFAFVAILSFPCVLSQSWEDPPFINDKPRPEIVYDPYAPTIGQIIKMDEEIPGDVTLARINYEGPDVPTLIVNIGDPDDLGAVISKKEDKWYLIITKSQDYETESQIKYTMTVKVQSRDVKIFLNIVNIDDNPPTIQGSTCQVPELFLGRTSCTYEVKDRDGDMSISVMTFSIEGRAGEEKMFDFIEERNDTSGRSMYVTLRTIQELDFELSQIHIFTIVASDSAKNEGNTTAIVQVIDMPNKPPMWKSIFASQTFEEKSHQTFTVIAVDGDTQINKRIFYKLSLPEPSWDKFFSIGTETGVLDVQPIDRDELEKEVFPFTISAYKEGNETWATTSDVVIIITDINDHSPEFDPKEFVLTIPEETFLSLEFNPKIFAHDKDLGENAQYTVELVGVKPADADRAFIIVPGEGYQLQEFQIIIINATALDFENVTWQNMELQIKAVEKFTDNNGTAIVKINLINWNDEEPIFDKSEYSASFKETVGKGYEIMIVHATDRDIGDDVKHSLVGSVNNYLEIDASSGLITVSADDAFDFDRQNEIIVQVQAEDTLDTKGEPYHVSFMQLIIKVIDVNNKSPEIYLPQATTYVKENTKAGVVITEDIRGFDIDSDSKISFTINWDKSTASKPGKVVQKDEFVGCVEIKTIYPNPDKTGDARGHLVVKEIREGVTIDFEEFEFLYLAIDLTDSKQVVGSSTTSSMLTVFIEDVNDNEPVWVDGTLMTKRIVREMADSDIVIGSVMATDKDGPLYNNVKYYLEESEDTPEGLVVIERTTGQLTVGKSKEISCDYPKVRDNLSYNLIASDCNDMDDVEEVCFKTPGEIKIDIIDINNKNPIPSDDEFDSCIEIYEDAKTGKDITKIVATDLDRDVPYHTISYAINFEGQAELSKYFSIDSSSGQVIVKLENGVELDRDEGPDSYEIFISLTDNPLQEGDGQRNTGSTKITVQLLDVNDNAPQMPSGLSWKLTENTKANVELSGHIIAPDKDQPDTDNSRVRYNILSFSGKLGLFTILSPDNKTGILKTADDLKGSWGTYTITIEAYDLGVPRLSTNMTYDLTITPYNYEKPSFVFPEVENTSFRLKMEGVAPGNLLYFADGTKFDDIEVSDPDGLDAGLATFEIIGKDEAADYFKIDPSGTNKGRLSLAKEIDEDHISFQITVRAKDKGTDPESLYTDLTFSVRFVPTEGDPYFENNAVTVKFTEFEGGLDEFHLLDEAIDPKNIGCIDDPLEESLFNLDKLTNKLTLAKELDREAKPRHTIRIAAANSPDRPNAIPFEKSILNVEILVKEANPKPKFTQLLYGGGIALTDVIGKLMFTLKATHTEDLKISYKMVEGSMAADPSLQAVADKAFPIDPDSGDTLLNFKPQDSMSGKFEFKVSATDTEGKVDIADVKIFMIAEENRISFIFENLAADVREKQTFVSETFTNIFGYLCNIDYVLIASVDGVAQENRTEVRTHFIENNTAVSSEQIAKQKSNVNLMRNLRDLLRTRTLYLEDFSTSTSSYPTESLEQMLQIVLIVVSSVLGTLCIVLLVAFCLRTKSLKRRLDALSTTKFGSQDSGLNRVAAAVPGTNKHAIEGSNPVWNEEIKAPDFDTISNASGDSDLIGIEDNPYFSHENTGNETQNNGKTFEKSKNGIHNNINNKGSVPRRVTKNNLHNQGI